MRLKLREGDWYAAEFIDDDLVHSGHRYSPIYISGVTPLKTGEGIFELKFFHANYPAGVQDKIYKLQTLHAGEGYILTRSVDHNSARFVLIYDITSEWLSRYFRIEVPDRETVTSWLDNEFRCIASAT